MLGDAPPPGFYAPDPYSSWWWWTGVAVLVVIALWFTAIWWATRPRPVRVPPRATGDRLTRLRADYTREIDLVAARVRTGEITPRLGHQQVSLLVRHFVQEASGIRAPTMTLTDLQATGARLTPVSDVVGALYPGEFGPDDIDPDGAQTLGEAVAIAKEVVARWT